MKGTAQFICETCGWHMECTGTWYIDEDGDDAFEPDDAVPCELCGSDDWSVFEKGADPRWI